MKIKVQQTPDQIIHYVMEQLKSGWEASMYSAFPDAEVSSKDFSYLKSQQTEDGKSYYDLLLEFGRMATPDFKICEFIE